MFNFSKTAADVKCEQAYDGYSPSKIDSSFDEAIKNAPVRQEWIDEQSDLSYIWHLMTTTTRAEWIGGLTFAVVTIMLLIAVLGLTP